MALALIVGSLVLVATIGAAVGFVAILMVLSLLGIWH